MVPKAVMTAADGSVPRHPPREPRCSRQQLDHQLFGFCVLFKAHGITGMPYSVLGAPTMLCITALFALCCGVAGKGEEQRAEEIPDLSAAAGRRRLL